MNARQVCTAATCFGLRTSVMSKMRMPRKRSALTGSWTPCVPQSSRPRVCSTDMISRLPWTDTSPWPPGHTTEETRRAFLGSSMSYRIEPVKAAEEEMVSLEREIREREAEGVQPRRRLIRGRQLRKRARVLHLGLGGRRAGAFGSRGLASRAPSESKNPSGLGRFVTSSMLCAALPARRGGPPSARYADRRALSLPHPPARHPGVRLPAWRQTHTAPTPMPSCLYCSVGERMSLLGTSIKFEERMLTTEIAE